MSPLIKTLKEHGIEVHVLTTGNNEGIVNAYKNIIDKGHFIRYEHFTQIPVNSLLMIKSLRRENYDVVIDAEQVIEFAHLYIPVGNIYIFSNI
jgi:ADP-heptose:LPS heptosyltransferase